MKQVLHCRRVARADHLVINERAAKRTELILLCWVFVDARRKSHAVVVESENYSAVYLKNRLVGIGLLVYALKEGSRRLVKRLAVLLYLLGIESVVGVSAGEPERHLGGGVAPAAAKPEELGIVEFDVAVNKLDILVGNALAGEGLLAVVKGVSYDLVVKADAGIVVLFLLVGHYFFALGELS